MIVTESMGGVDVDKEKQRLLYAMNLAFNGVETVILDKPDGKSAIFDPKTGLEIVKGSDSLSNKFGTNDLRIFYWLLSKVIDKERQLSRLANTCEQTKNNHIKHELDHLEKGREYFGEKLMACLEIETYRDSDTMMYFHIARVIILNNMTREQKRGILLAPEELSSLDYYYAQKFH